MRALAPSPSLSPSLPRAPSPPLAPSPPQVSMTFEWERLVVKGRDETTDEWGEPRSTSSRASSVATQPIALVAVACQRHQL